MSVRPRLGSDLPSCARALAAVHGQTSHPYPLVWPGDPIGWLTPDGLSAAWVGLVEGGQSGGLTRDVVRSDGEDGAGEDVGGGDVVGNVCVQRGLADAVVVARTGRPERSWATLSRLFVAPSARGQGLGSALLETAAQYAAGAGLRLTLDVVGDDGPAIDLYERLGWQLVERRRADWTASDGSHPILRTYIEPWSRPDDGRL